MVKIKDFEQKQGKVDISIDTIMSKDQKDVLKKQLDSDVKKAMDKYNRKKKNIMLRKKSPKTKIAFQKMKQVDTHLPVSSSESRSEQDEVPSVSHPVLPRNNGDASFIKSHLNNVDSQVQSLVSSKTPLTDSGLDEVKLLKEEIRANKKLLKLRKKEMKLRQKLEKKGKGKIDTEGLTAEDSSVKPSVDKIVPSFDNPVVNDFDDVSLASTNIDKIKFCTSCGKRLKKSSVRREGDSLVQVFSCKGCKLSDEVRFLI